MGGPAEAAGPQPPDRVDPRPVPPEPPLPWDCCDSGCDRCVHDIHAEELAHYQQQLEAWKRRNPGRQDDT